MDFIKKLCVYDLYAIQYEELITYDPLVQEATRQYRNLFGSKRW